MSYILFNTKKSNLIQFSANVKHMGYKRQCTNCKCPIFKGETVCPECKSKKIINL